MDLSDCMNDEPYAQVEITFFFYFFSPDTQRQREIRRSSFFLLHQRMNEHPSGVCVFVCLTCVRVSLSLARSLLFCLFVRVMCVSCDGPCKSGVEQLTHIHMDIISSPSHSLSTICKQKLACPFSFLWKGRFLSISLALSLVLCASVDSKGVQS